MKTFFSILLFLFVIACSSKETAFRETPSGPQLQFPKDTLYLREKDPNNLNGNGIFLLQALPAGPQLHIRLYDSSGHVQFNYRGQTLANDQPVVVAGEWNSLFCVTDTAGVFGIDVSLMDQLGRVQYKSFVVQSAAAQRPKAGLSWRPDFRDPDGRRYYFDASSSHQPYGKIMQYCMFIGTNRIISSADQFLYNFHQKGTYPILFYAIDDLGQFSDTIQTHIEIL
jgi:hypothetical protein